MENFEERLKGGHPNSLGNTIEIVEEILVQNNLFDELYNCYFSTDEVVRLRVSNAMKRICKEKEQLLIPYIDKFIVEISQINQASAQWTLAQLFAQLRPAMTDIQIQRSQEIMKYNLEKHNDWIVLNATMETLGKWSMGDSELKNWLYPHLKRLATDKRKSVSKRAQKLKKQLYPNTY